MTKVTLPAPREPAIDPRTGTLTRNWILYFQQVFERIGGSDADTITAISAAIRGILQSLSDNEVADVFEPLPVDQTPQIEAERLNAPSDLSATVSELAKQVEDLSRQLASMRDPGASVAEVSKRIDGLDSQPEAAPALLHEIGKKVSDIEIQLAIELDYGAALAEANKTLKTLGTMATQNANAVAITGGTASGLTSFSTTSHAGIGTTASSWFSNVKAVELPNGVALAAAVSATDGMITSNARIDSTGAWKRLVAAASTLYEISGGVHYFYVAPSGAAGSTITWTLAFKILNDGTVSVNSGTMLRTATSFTNGAGASSGTLTNAPSAGNPTKWVPIDDNGTTRYIPAW